MDSRVLWGACGDDICRPPAVRRSEVLAGLSYALDLTEGQRPGHAVRTTLVGMRLAHALALSEGDRQALFYTLLTKDLGCSSNAARFAALFGHHDQDIKAALKTIDGSHALESLRFVARSAAPTGSPLQRVWKIAGLFARGPEGARAVVRTRCERGAEIAALIGLSPAVADGIRGLDEHWDGQGQPYGTRGEEIPLLARIAGLAQTVEVFATAYDVPAAFDMAAARSGRWFDPVLVDALRSFEDDGPFWQSLVHDPELDTLRAFPVPDEATPATDAELDRIAEGFGRVIDAKSPWTFRHSSGVAAIAVGIGRRLGVGDHDLRVLYRTALLHDIGKLGVSSLILDKPGPLTAEEIAAIRRHTGHTAAILGRVACFRPVAGIAAAHHERLDGRGYHRGLPGEDLTLASRILAVADIADALRATRPYRAGLSIEQTLSVLDRDRQTGVDPVCLEVLGDVLCELPLDSPASPARIVGSLAEDYTQAA